MRTRTEAASGTAYVAVVRLVAAWHAAGVSLKGTHRTILLGCVSESLALLGQPGGQPARILRCFKALLH